MRAMAILISSLALMLFSQQALSEEAPTTYDSSSELAATLTSVSRSAVTRDNHISVFLTHFQLAPVETPTESSEPTRYALVLDLNLLPDSGTNGESYSYVLEQPLEVSPGTNEAASLSSGFRTILSNASLKNVREMYIRIQLIRLDAAAREQFTKVASLFGSIVQRSMYAPLLSVLGIDPSAPSDQTKVITFEGRFLIPTNYWTHQNARRTGLATITNDEPIAIAFQSRSPRSNTNVVSFLKNTINKIGSVVAGKQVLRNYDNVQGFAALTFTKNQYSPLPRSLGDSLDRIKASAEQTEIPENFDALMGNTRFLFENLATDMPATEKESVATFLELAKLYADWRKIDEAETVEAQSAKKLVANFQAWLTQSTVRLQEQPEFGPRVKGVYTSTDSGELFPIIMYPYGLSDPLIVSSVLWELRLHQFVAEAAKTNPSIKLAKFTFRPPASTTIASTAK